MSVIDWIRIRGFRGLLSEVFLPFASQGRPQSLILFGYNGTGKSSITDALEWLHTGHILHLKREGAGPKAYPHCLAVNDASFIEVKFHDEHLGTVRQTFDSDRPTIPHVVGRIEEFRRRARHPFYLRFGDLTRFVYLTKGERFDVLAQLMGFMPQVTYQKGLRRVGTKLDELLTKCERDVSEREQRIASRLDLQEVTGPAVMRAVRKYVSACSIRCGSTIEGVRSGVAALKSAVAADSRSAALAELKSALRELKSVVVPDQLLSSAEDYAACAQPFKEQEGRLKDLLLISLYKSAKKVLISSDISECCPLCGRVFPGNLLEHVRLKHQQFEELRIMFENVEQRRKLVLSTIEGLKFPGGHLVGLDSGGDLSRLGVSVSALRVRARRVEDAISRLQSAVVTSSEHVDSQAITTIIRLVRDLRKYLAKLGARRKIVIECVELRIDKLSQDESRNALVETLTRSTAALEDWDSLVQEKDRLQRLQDIRQDYSRIVDDYGSSCSSSVRGMFDRISGDVARFFAFMEPEGEGLSKPVLSLQPDQDRSVTLQVIFHGETIDPAYKYLSESQLNSFGLAVFLASAKAFKSEFPFVILDDVINSFDAHKRPQLIRLLKEEFSEFQVLLLTHDQVWRNRLSRECPQWQAMEFFGYEYGHGPKVREGKSSIGRIQELLQEERTNEAGTALGVHMEQRLQEIGEAFEMWVPYRSRNDHTLEPLLQYLRKRVKDKLGSAHDLYQMTGSVLSAIGFRNLCSHYREPSAPLVPSEITDVLELWMGVESLIRCSVCSEVARYDGSASFKCRCGQKILSRS